MKIYFILQFVLCTINLFTVEAGQLFLQTSNKVTKNVSSKIEQVMFNIKSHSDHIFHQQFLSNNRV